MSKIIFVVEFLRNDSREEHSYVGGVFDDELEALKEAWAHINMRAGKYGAEITGYTLNQNDEVYWRKLDSWEGFVASCKKTAEKVREMLDAEEKET